VQLRSSADDPLKRALFPLDLPSYLQWTLSSLVRPSSAYPPSPPPVILVSGPKASGKSTISRYLTNTYLTSSPADQPKTTFWSDLDPGQPEFSAPGQVSLVQLSAPVIGPPFTHSLSTATTPQQRLIRSHTLAAITPKEDTDHFLSCAIDLISHYSRQRYAFPTAPLIINCSGWVLGSAVTVLKDLIKHLHVTNTILMAPMAPDVVSEIETLLPRGRVLVIPTRDSKPIQTRTNAEFRAMTTQSYFHSIAAPRPLPPQLPTDTTTVSTTAIPQIWDTRPLSHHTPHLVPFTSLFALASYGEPLDPVFATTVINGMVLAICIIEDDAAFSPLLASEDAVPETLITSSPEGLPVLLPSRDGIVRPLDPTHTRCLGLAIVRGVDVENRELQLLTPVPLEEILDAIVEGGVEDEGDECTEVEKGKGGQADEDRGAKSRVVLVRGKFDSPDWAFLEDVYAGVEGVQGRERPYVAEKKGGTVGLGANVWRVRHLPRKSGGAGGG